MLSKLPADIKIVEVGPRDGLQNEKSIISTKDKIEFVKLLSKTGLKNIEVTSFVKPSAIPQMSDAIDLWKGLKDVFKKNINYPCLVPNKKGYETAKSLGVKEIALFTATSDSFTKKNINCTVKESFERMKEVSEQAIKDNIKMRGYISTSYGCPYEGKIPLDKLLEVAESFFKLGVYEISIGDTIGVASPKEVATSIAPLKKIESLNKIAFHFHDTHGMALSNILVALDSGASIFDSAAGGLGGCPYAKGATGNVATEDVLYLMESLGVKTGVDFEAVAEASKFILKATGKETPSKHLTAYLKANS